MEEEWSIICYTGRKLTAGHKQKTNCHFSDFAVFAERPLWVYNIHGEIVCRLTDGMSATADDADKLFNSESTSATTNDTSAAQTINHVQNNNTVYTSLQCCTNISSTVHQQPGPVINQAPSILGAFFLNSQRVRFSWCSWLLLISQQPVIKTHPLVVLCKMLWLVNHMIDNRNWS